MKLTDFSLHFPDEQSCRSHLKAEREQEGIKCRKCGHGAHKWSDITSMWSCSHCGFRTSLKSNTIMQDSKLPVRYWYHALHLMTATKKGYSALEIQRQLGHKRYEPIWQMVHKIRISMGERDDRYKLGGGVEMDEGFFEHVLLDKEEREQVKENGLKRGRGSQKQAKVLVMVESVAVICPKKHRKKKKCGHLKMKVLEALDADTIGAEVVANVDNEVEMETDAFKGYDLDGKVASHTIYNTSKLDVNEKLPWVHTVIANAKRGLLATYHMVGDKYMQYYLDEFCYRFNRRFMKAIAFTRGIAALITGRPVPNIFAVPEGTVLANLHLLK